MALADLLTLYGTRVVGVAVLAGVGAAMSALVYRLFTRDALDRGVSLLVGLAAAALYLNVRTSLGQVVLGETQVLSAGPVLFNTAALAAAAMVTPAGHAAGDRVARDFVSVSGARELDGEVGRLARTVGRVTTLTVPDEISDIDGYDPVPETTKSQLAGTTLVFPRRVATDALRERLAARLKEEYEVGYVDAEFEDRELVALGLGARQAGIGPTLAPGAAAVPIRADPPNAASPGDVVQVYERGPDPQRVATAEVRATAGDVVTVACDVPEARTLAGGDYRLVTLPVEPRAEREFASLLRAADETIAAVTLGPESALVGSRVGDVDANVVAVRDAAGGVEPIPSRDRPLAAGESLYVVARPETIRSLEERA
ncbi:MAG: TrkA C-terminal domain-containing protein [Halobacteriaceae archaeon]